MAATDDEKSGGSKGRASSSGPSSTPGAGVAQTPSSGKGQRSSAAAAALLERGLAMYGDGDLLGAITEWEAALTIDPGLARAREYVEYVRANFDALTQQFEAARDAERSSESYGVPFVEVPEMADAYDSLDVELSVPADPEEEGDETDGRPDDLSDGLAALDAGLEDALASFAGRAPITRSDENPAAAIELEAMAPDEDLPGMAPDLEDSLPPLDLDPILDPGPGDGGSDDLITSVENIDLPDEDEATIDVRMHRILKRSAASEEAPAQKSKPGTLPPVVTIQPRASDEVRLPVGTLDEDVRTTLRGLGGHGIKPQRPPSARESIDLDDESEATRAYAPASSFPASSAQEPAATARRTGSAGHLDYSDIDLAGGDDLDDLHATSERQPFRSGNTPAKPAPSSKEKDSSVIVDEKLLRGAGLIPSGPSSTGQGPAGSTDLERTVEFRQSARRDSGSRDVRAASITRRVTDLLDKAQAAADRGAFLEAVGAVEEATGCDSDGVIAPVLLHRHRDLLYRIYEGHIGDMKSVPLVAVPLHEIAAQSLDHRTGFLLSRIDGMLTFEDVLDVAGMPRMEAYQILSSLLRKGMIEVR